MNGCVHVEREREREAEGNSKSKHSFYSIVKQNVDIVYYSFLLRSVLVHCFNISNSF